MAISGVQQTEVGQYAPLQEPRSLDSAVVVSRLEDKIPGIRADIGGKTNRWHPGIGDFQGLYYNDRHICSMDRGRMPMWPIWSTTQGDVQVPIDYALAHDDFPVVESYDGSTYWDDSYMASVQRPVLDDVTRIGWAEVFYQLIKRGYVTKQWIEAMFGVPMDWIDSVPCSPLQHSFNLGSEKSWLPQ